MKISKNKKRQAQRRAAAGRSRHKSQGEFVKMKISKNKKSVYFSCPKDHSTKKLGS